MITPGVTGTEPPSKGRSLRHMFDGFGIRLGLVMTLALLPVGVMGVMQASDLVEAARERSEAALAGETLRMVRPHLARIQMAQGAAATLAQIDPAACAPVVTGLMAAGQDLLFAGLYSATGDRLCGAGQAPPRLPPISQPDQSRFVGVAQLEGHGSTMLVLHRQNGAGRGFAAVAPRNPSMARSDTAGFALLLFDAQGEVLSIAPRLPSSDDLLPDSLGLAAVAQADVATFSSPTRQGEDRAYSVVRLVDGLYALGTWPATKATLGDVQALPVAIFPALMWAISLIAAWAAAETLVTTHIRRLRTAITAFAGGNRRVQTLDMSHAPRELRETAAAFDWMTETILQDEARLEDSLRQTETLLREVHHRVKNNLQLIASIVNIQLRKTTSDDVRAALTSLQDRMLGLATIHDRIYQGPNLAEVAMHDLFPGIVDQILRRSGARDRGLRVESRFDPMDVPLDMAVPLALLLTEAVSNAIRFADAPSGKSPYLRVSLFGADRGEAKLEVINSVIGLPSAAMAAAEQGSGIGTQLLRGFTRQLSGSFAREFLDDECRLSIWLPLETKS